MIKWKNVKLSDAGEIITGKTPKTNINEYWENGNILFLTPSDNMDNKYIYDTKRKITNRGMESIKNCYLDKPSVCVSCIGSDLGKVVINKKSCVTNQQINSFICGDKVDLDFMYYMLLIEGQKLNYYSKTSTAVPIVNKTEFSNIELPLPPLPTQRRIAAILSSLDDKIENNRKTAEKLEEIAQAIFKRWFVDFEFPNEDGVPYKSSGGEMIYCEELGKDVPKGWKVGTINDCCKKIQNGGTPRRNIDEYWNSNDIFWLTSGEVRENIICKVENYISKKGFENSSAKLLQKYATVVALYGATAGQVALLAVPTTTNQAISGLVAKKHYTFYNYILLSISSRELFNKAIGSAQQNISKKIVEEFKTILPNDKLLAKFDDTISKIYDLLISKLNENIILEQSRDTLLPKLMSGEIEV